MGIIEGILYMLWRGLAIGIIISAPMGPVGILCVQRTLDKGRKTGLYTGIGAAISDLLYCLLTGFGLSFIEDFIERNSNILQLVGSVVLIVFGIYLFRSNPSKKLKRPGAQPAQPGKNILNGFLFTFSNPLIIFLIIGLFARFNFLLPEIKFYHYMVGFVGIFSGALLWWYVVTYFVDRVRSHFNLRSMWLINKIIGSIIFLFAIVGIVTAASGLASAELTHYKSLNSVAGFQGLKGNVETDERFVLNGIDTISTSRWLECRDWHDFQLAFRAANVRNLQKYHFPWWGLKLKGRNGEARIRFVTEDDRFEPGRLPRMCILLEKNGKIIVRKELTKNVDMFDGWNALDLKYIKGELSLMAGNRRYEMVFDSEPLQFVPDSIGWEVAPFASLQIDNVEIYRSSPMYEEKNPGYSDAESLEMLFKDAEDELEGVWTELDRSFDTSSLKPGGGYNIAVKSAGQTTYDIIYLSGAKINNSKWESGMKKGVLKNSPLEGIYKASWIDSEFCKIDEEMRVQVEDGVMRIVMPTLNSEIRFAKVAPNRYPAIFAE